MSVEIRTKATITPAQRAELLASLEQRMGLLAEMADLVREQTDSLAHQVKQLTRGVGTLNDDLCTFKSDNELIDQLVGALEDAIIFIPVGVAPRLKAEAAIARAGETF